MAVAGESREHEGDLLALAVDDRLDVGEQPAGEVGRSAEQGRFGRVPLNARHVDHASRAVREGRTEAAFPDANSG